MNALARLTAVLLLCCCCVQGYNYMYWSQSGVDLTNLFTIDHSNQRIILAAKNSICHLTLDLQQTALNVQNATPNASEINFCMTDQNIFQSESNCQNFHHILLFPTSDDNLTLANNSTVPFKETILVCGSNAYQPRCFYRYRTNLTIAMSYSAQYTCPYDRDSTTASILSSNGNLVSGTSLNVRVNRYGLTLSHAPYRGNILVRTLENNNMFNEPDFVDIYEHSDYYYYFMRETAVEVPQSPIYSRVARVCKNDNGTLYDVSGVPYNVFTTNLKARMICSSVMKSNSDFPYTFNNLQDTVRITNSSGEYLYTIFTSSENGPDGSALCVYSFNDLDNIFTQSYYKPIGVNQWTEVDNDNPVSCNGPTRSISDANSLFLMRPSVEQTGQPLVQQDGFRYKRLIVDQVQGVDGVQYDVLLIAATSSDNLHFFKKTYVSSREGENVFTSQSLTLERNTNDGSGQQVGKMELYKNATNVTVYISTNEGVYGISISDCSSMYAGCSECVSSRDPYCAFSVTAGSCVSTINNNTDVSLIQDIVSGSTSRCPVVSTTVTPSPTTSSSVIASTTLVSIPLPTTTTKYESTSATLRPVPPSSSLSSSSSKPAVVTPTITDEPKLETTSASSLRIVLEPTIRPVNENTNSVEEHTWTIVAGSCGIIIGVVCGFLLFALVRNKNRFCWGKFLSRRRRYNYDEEEKSYELTTKPDQRNNSTEYSKVSQRSSTPPLSKNNPSNDYAPAKVTDSPVLTKYTNTGRTHNRSMSSGGQLPCFMPTNGTSTPVASSPMGPNLRSVFHVEEPVNNTHHLKYGKNMVGRQLSKEYPMTNNPSHVTTGFHMKTGSLDLDYDRYK